jgi:hypothetical protein
VCLRYLMREQDRTHFTQIEALSAHLKLDLAALEGEGVDSTRNNKNCMQCFDAMRGLLTTAIGKENTDLANSTDCDRSN